MHDDAIHITFSVERHVRILMEASQFLRTLQITFVMRLQMSTENSDNDDDCTIFTGCTSAHSVAQLGRVVQWIFFQREIILFHTYM